jgi:hypothetical protein
VVPGKARLTLTVWPALRMTLASSSKIASCRRAISGRLTGQWLVTCDVVSAPVLHLRHLLSGAEIPGVPSRGRMDSRLRWISFHNSSRFHNSASEILVKNVVKFMFPSKIPENRRKSQKSTMYSSEKFFFGPCHGFRLRYICPTWNLMGITNLKVFFISAQ